MSSQLDLDQGGTFRQTQKVYLGPSVGWVEVAEQWILNVTTSGVTTLSRGTNIVLVNSSSPPTIQLPSSKASLAGAQAVPKQFAIVPLIIADVGGQATNNNITVLPFGAETIAGLASIAITVNYGSLVLNPNIVSGGWNFAA